MTTMDAFYKRIAVWKDTEANAPSASASSVKERHDPGYAAFMSMPPPRYPPRSPVVVDADTIDLGRALARQGLHPLLLILADDSFPGGCVYTGSGAQEESVFRRTNVFRSLDIRHYPLRDDEAVFVPCVSVFKEGEAAGFARHPPYLLDFVACPAIRHPYVAEDGRLSDSDAAKLAIKVELVLQVAHKNGHDALVLGAMGCGAWKNPPDHVAEIMRDVLQRHAGAFREVAIAILRTTPGYVTRLDVTRRDNYAAFSSAFASEVDNASPDEKTVPPTVIVG